MDEGRTTKDDGDTQGIPAHQTIFQMSAKIAAQIVAHAQSGYPDEVCGLVAGRGDVATAAYPGHNISPTPADTYELDHDTLARMIDFEDAGLELVAIYHSHPHGPDRPSPTDIASATYPDSVHLIVSFTAPDEPKLMGFRISCGNMQKIKTRIG
jgi:proteasome lid subunit RPN8/RPN11